MKIDQPLKVNKLSHDTTLVVRMRLTRQLRFRAWIAARLIMLAAIVLGCGFEMQPMEWVDAE